MLISIENLRERERKKVIRKVYYLKKKFRHKKCFFITITFSTMEDYIKFDREDRKKMMNNLIKNYGLVAGFSVVEAQKRGVPHIHMLAWLPRGIFLDKKFSKIYSIGMTNIQRVKNKYIIYYLMKYMLKENEENKEKIRYKNKQRFYSFYYKNKRKDKEWVLKGLSGINKILRKYEIKSYKVKENKYIFLKNTIIKYRIETKFLQEGLYIRNWQVKVNDEEYSKLDFRDYMEFLEWFECLIEYIKNIN